MLQPLRCAKVDSRLTTDYHAWDAEQMIASANIVARELPWLWWSGSLPGHLMERLTSLPEIPRLRRHPPGRRRHRRVSRGRRIGLDPEAGPQPNDTLIVLDTVIFVMMMEWHDRAYIVSACSRDTLR